MSIAEWLAAREPAPPAPLGSALTSFVDDPRLSGGRPAGLTDGGVLSDDLAAAARQRLDEALSRPGRVRESGFRLLEADALFTYACEAAMEGDDREVALRRILTIASG